MLSDSEELEAAEAIYTELEEFSKLFCKTLAYDTVAPDIYRAALKETTRKIYAAVVEKLRNALEEQQSVEVMELKADNKRLRFACDNYINIIQDLESKMYNK